MPLYGLHSQHVGFGDDRCSASRSISVMRRVIFSSHSLLRALSRPPLSKGPLFGGPFMARPLSDMRRTPSSEHLNGMASGPSNASFLSTHLRRPARPSGDPSASQCKPPLGRLRAGAALLTALPPLSWNSLYSGLPPMRVPDELWGAVNAVSAAVTPGASFRRSPTFRKVRRSHGPEGALPGGIAGKAAHGRMMRPRPRHFMSRFLVEILRLSPHTPLVLVLPCRAALLDDSSSAPAHALQSR